MIRVLVCSHIRLYREGLGEILAQDRTLDVVGVASTGEESVAGADALLPDVVLLDMAMPGGITTVSALEAAASDVRVIALGVGAEDAEVIACAEAGVLGFVTREQSLAELRATIQSVARDENLCSPRITATLPRRVRGLGAARTTGTDARLTARQLEILALIDRGLSNKEIASRLWIELPTVKNHVHNILDRLGARRRTEALAALRARGVTLPAPAPPQLGSSAGLTPTSSS
jgi:two-component system, NarL family, nitrate/nitrite response regulator NarL